MRILIISMPYVGHITPTFSMAKKLISKGHIVDYLTTEKWGSVINEIGATLISYIENEKVSLMITHAYKTALFSDEQYDGIVYDELFFPGRILGDTLGVPAIRYFPCVAINREIMERLIQGNGFMGIFRSRFIRKKWTKSICKNLIPDIHDWTEEVAQYAPKCNIVFTADWFQPYRKDFSSDNYFFAGPSIWKNTDEKVDDWLPKTDGPVVYVSLGTIDNRQLKFYKKSFEVFADKKARFVVSVGNRVSIKQLGSIPENCAVYPFVPQREILGCCDLFITHGGMNSVNEAVVAGVPMLVIPISNDQPINAERVVELGLGKMFDIRHMDYNTLWPEIQSILFDGNISTHISEAQKKISKYDGGEIAGNVIISFLEK